jgi:phosphoribosylaminoimidazole (AIR) synthetase
VRRHCRARPLIDGSRCEPGDVVIGFASSGLHTNGFTLVRELLGDDEIDAELLLTPHRLYLARGARAARQPTCARSRT